VPAQLPEGLAIVGVPERADPRDALCGAASLSELADGAVVGTSSLRRRAQLLASRPGLDVRDLRGNVDTRLRRLADGELDAIVVAAAGLRRLGREQEASFLLDLEEMIPAAGQGALALQAREDDAEVREAVAAISDEGAIAEVTAERAAVAALEASCNTPIGIHARLDGDRIAIEGFAGLPDGSEWVRESVNGDAADPAAAGEALAQQLLAAGAEKILREAEGQATRKEI
jgi:hydroxymethylbilane synthase